jgi:hypothetical protein
MMPRRRRKKEKEEAASLPLSHKVQVRCSDAVMQ